MKTGFIDESGYNIAVTAQRDGMRLISVGVGSTRGADHGTRALWRPYFDCVDEHDCPSTRRML